MEIYDLKPVENLMDDSISKLKNLISDNKKVAYITECPGSLN